MKRPKNPHWIPSVNFLSKLIHFFLEFLILKIIFLRIKIDDFRGDLSDISAKTAYREGQEPTADTVLHATVLESSKNSMLLLKHWKIKGANFRQDPGALFAWSRMYLCDTVSFLMHTELPNPGKEVT